MSKDTQKETKEKTKRVKKAKKDKFFSGTGRRKRAIARVWLFPKKGEMIVNNKPIKEYFTDGEDTLDWVAPFHAIGVSHPQAKFSATVKISGGGKKAQVGAIRHGFSRALISYDPQFKAILRTSGFLTRDSRKKERKKPFLRKARKRPQYSKR